MAARVAVKTMLLHCAAAIARTIPPAAQECKHDEIHTGDHIKLLPLCYN